MLSVHLRVASPGRDKKGLRNGRAWCITTALGGRRTDPSPRGRSARHGGGPGHPPPRRVKVLTGPNVRTIGA